MQGKLLYNINDYLYLFQLNKKITLAAQVCKGPYVFDFLTESLCGLTKCIKV
jgi:hypothetical protein